MEAVLDSGIELILWIQSVSPPWLDAFFKGFTKVGAAYYFFLIPLLVWCVDRRLGVRVMALFTLSLVLNSTLKHWIALPRPFDFDPRVISDGEFGYSLPSGHAQLAVVYWGLIAIWVERSWFWVVAALMMFLIGYSRVHLGVHFPSDVVAGWVIGLLTLFAWMKRGESIEQWIYSADNQRLMTAGVGIAAAIFVFDALLVQDHENTNSGSAGLFAGITIALAAGRAGLAFEGRGLPWKRVVRFALGVTLSILLVGGMSRLGAPGVSSDNALAIRLVVALDLAVLGFFIVFAAPWLFDRIGLGDRT